MRLRTFSARTMTEAMKLVRRELGPDAVIISTRDDGEGTTVTAALDTPDSTTFSLAAEIASDVSETINESLTNHGVPSRLHDRLLSASYAFEGEDPLVALAGALAQVFSFDPIGKVKAREKPLLLVGPPGAGKTVSIAKLAARAVMSGEKVRLITTDTVRAGGIEQLEALARILRLKLYTCENAPRLGPVVAEAEDELVLIDSPGVNPYSASDRRELQTLLSVAKAEPLFVMAAGGDAVDAIEMARIFHELGSKRMVVTRLDMVNRLGSVLAAAEAAGLSLAEAGVSAAIADGLVPYNPVVLARHMMPKAVKTRAQPLARRGLS